MQDTFSRWLDRQAGDVCAQGQEGRRHSDKGQLEGVSTILLTRQH